MTTNYQNEANHQAIMKMKTQSEEPHNKFNTLMTKK